MPRPKVLEILTEGVREHRAVQAWLQVQPDSCAPRSLELLQRRRYSTVYRLNGVTQDGKRVIAKRCRAATARIERMIYQELLPLTEMAALQCYGAVQEPDGEFCWVFLEDATGASYSPQLPHNRALAGRWLAETQLATASPNLQSCLPNRALNHYLQSLHGCREIVLHHLSGSELPATDLAQFTDRVASPDLSIYCSILRREHSHLDLRDIQAVAACGNLLRMVDQISWATAGHEFVPPSKLVKVIALLGSYEASMIEALSAFRMELT